MRRRYFAQTFIIYSSSPCAAFHLTLVKRQGSATPSDGYFSSDGQYNFISRLYRPAVDLITSGTEYVRQEGVRRIGMIEDQTRSYPCIPAPCGFLSRTFHAVPNCGPSARRRPHKEIRIIVFLRISDLDKDKKPTFNDLEGGLFSTAFFMISLEKHDSTSAHDRILQTERYGYIAARDPQVMSGTIFRMLQNHWSDILCASARIGITRTVQIYYRPV